mmetsp:Transcript_17916/g.33334  ORF Transcript_17916/g.33334 Transcript_17916/m.33334 type:complete len:139 (-) Transcript_17916:17-433(-)|eukprot:CAMPEP_0197438552 /NCGR_PEP_ID=MMETSP1175-20131217/5513_1 /TAXON_ID=1003142 /ORGANISM="Triceratium dubium, Strain CCMP147" /LENGTH=138 /DNA_ID=CAMNT_0042968303 /DNA_START=183 /DNA_END=599 /DNA_ORIENTATION=-
MRLFVFVAVLFATVTTGALAAERSRDRRSRSGRSGYRRAGGDKERMADMLRERHEQRKEKMAEMIEERKSKLADHSAGRKLLNDEEHERFSRQIVNFGRKLEQLNSMTDAEREDMIAHEVDMMDRMKERERDMFRRDL